jgi:hypothetical protein
MRRPPKENKDGCKTLRLYCALSCGTHTCKADVARIEENTGLKDEYCFFALSFKYVAESKTWILNDSFSTERLWHTHPFYHSYIEGLSPGSDINNSPETNSRRKQGKQVNQYFKNYRALLSKLQKMDTILTFKQQGGLKPIDLHGRG